MVVDEKWRIKERDRTFGHGDTRASNTYELHQISYQQIRMRGEKGETVNNNICECSKLAQKEYRRRHNNVAWIFGDSQDV